LAYRTPSIYADKQACGRVPAVFGNPKEEKVAFVNNTLLLVDDDEYILKQMLRAFEAEYGVLTATDESAALRLCEQNNPAVVILDLSLNPSNHSDLAGLRLLETILAHDPSTRVIIVTGNNEDMNALRAMRLGAFDYYFKPICLEELKIMVHRAFHIHELHRRIYQTYPAPEAGFHCIIGSSKSMRQIFGFIERVAVSDISVLIFGESGTGKELVAHAIHRQSSRNAKPFVAVNCGAIPETLLESELFGHEKGAFTGAYSLKRGRFERAHTGTLFLDEIGELAPSLQVKLLRFLQDRKIERVGGIQSMELDVRILAATNRDLKKDMENQVFRQDLYYRLKVVPLDIPPLRERKEDILTLAHYFLKQYCQEHHRAPMTLSSEAEEALHSYSWPGNVRELENVIGRAVVLSPNPVLKRSDLGLGAGPIASNVNLKIAKKAIEEDFVKKALSRNKGIVSRAAKDLGISRVNLYELIHKYGIQIGDFKAQESCQTRQEPNGGMFNWKH
jgi:two-component system, NtrC family, response regulator